MLPLLLLLTAVRPLYAGPSWAAFEQDHGRICLALARSELVAPRGKVQPAVAVAFDRGGPRHGQIAFRLDRIVRPGSAPLLTVGDQPFLLVAAGDRAWSRDSAQDLAIIERMRGDSTMRLSYRAAGGGGYSERFQLAGAPTAIDAAAAACSR